MGAWGFIATTGLVALTGACGPIPKIGDLTRTSVSVLDFSKYAGTIRPARDGTPPLAMLEEIPESLSACEWLKSLEPSALPERDFRLASRLSVKKVHSTRVEFSGRTDMGFSPLYQYALPKEIPNKDEFLQLVDDMVHERNERPPSDDWGDDWSRVFLPIALPLKYLRSMLPLKQTALWIYQQRLNSGLVDVDKERNKIVQGALEQVFPGAFDEGDNAFSFQDSFPEVLLANGAPSLASWAPNSSDSSDEVRRKLQQLSIAVQPYAVPKALFGADWNSFRREMSTGLAAALRGYSSRKPPEEVCATVLLHRAFAQLLASMGFERPLLLPNPHSPFSHLPKLDRLLEDTRGTHLRTCHVPGLFSYSHDPVILTPEFLENYSPKIDELHVDLLARPAARANCTPPWTPSEFSNISADSTAATARATELIEFSSGVGHFLMALSPAGPWWKSSSFAGVPPMARFDQEMQRNRDSHATLPTQAHALALAFLNLAMKNLVDRNFVAIDIHGHEWASPAQPAAGLRISESSHIPGSGGLLRSRARAAALVTDFALKFEEYLVGLRAWSLAARAQWPAPTYFKYVQYAFGSVDNLEGLIKEGPDGFIARLERLEFGATVLLTTLARRLPSGEATCYAELVSDLDQGQEQLSGECDASDHELWKKALRHAQLKYASPLINELAR